MSVDFHFLNQRGNTMSFLKNLKSDDSIQTESDSLGGSTLLESNVYPCKITLAYLTTSDGGAMALNIRAKTEDDKEIRQQFWMTSGTANGCKNYYEDKNGEKKYLPGFLMANALSLLTTGKEISEQDTEEKVVPLWSTAVKMEVPTKVPMFMDMLNKDVILAVLKQTVDKTTKNDRGEYVPTGETREENEVDKIFHAETRMTTAEIRGKAEKATFIDQWTAKWAGKTKNKSKGADGAVKSGAPKTSVTINVKPTSSLFG